MSTLQSVTLPDGRKVPWYGKMPKMTKARTKICVYQTGPLLWVSLPHDVDPKFLRGIQGSNYDASMKMYCVQTAYLSGLIRALYHSPQIREAYWPVYFEGQGLQKIADEVLRLVVEAERTRTGESQEEVPLFLEHKQTMPRAYQYDAAKYLTTMGKAILALPLGSGKGCTVITGLKLLREQKMPPFRGALVICPAALKELVWKREVEKFSDFTPIVIEGPKKIRDAQYTQPADVYIINPELLHRDYAAIRKLVGRLSAVIVDEASILRNPEAAVSKMVRSLSADKQNLWLMTGTPLMNSVMELHALTSLVDPHIFRSRAEFQRTYVPKAKDGSWMLHKVKNADDLVQRVAPVMFARTPSELRGELPDSTSVVVPVEITPEQRKRYEEYRQGAAHSLALHNECEDHRERIIHANNVLANITRMRRVCNGDEPGLGDPKMERLLEMMSADLINEKVLVFSQFATTADRILKALRDAGHGAEILSGDVSARDRSKAVDKYMKDPSCKAFVMTTAGGMGLNLTKTTAVVYYDMLWNPQMMHQIAGRAIRLGNTAPHVRILSMVATNTIEEHIVNRLHEKAITFNQVMHSEEITPEDTEGNWMFQEMRQMLNATK